jgi:hypothetical protein
MHAGAQQEAPPAPAAPVETDGEARRAKKRRKAKHGASEAGADGAEEQEAAAEGISLFGGSGASGEANGSGGASTAPVFVDSEPQVQTGDPFEEANVIRKAHRIKVNGLQIVSSRCCKPGEHLGLGRLGLHAQ